MGLFGTLILAATIVFSWNGTDYADTFSILLNWFISPVSALTGMFCVVLAARGHVWTYVYGLANCITYGLIACVGAYYGDMLLNWIVLLPMQFVGWFWWKKHLRQDTKVYVIMRRLKWWKRLLLIVGGLAATVLIGFFLYNADGWISTTFKRNVSIYKYIDGVLGLPFLGSAFDASTEVLQIAAQVLMVLAFAEQWGLWMLTNIITIIMWTVVLVAEPASFAWVMPTLVMWVAYLINSIYGFALWRKGAKLYSVSMQQT